MAWATPVTHTTGDIVTASDWNIAMNDLTFLSGSAGATVATSESTASTTYTALTTAGPAVTLTTGTSALVIVDCQLYNNAAGILAMMGYDISGATTSTITGTGVDTWSVMSTSPFATQMWAMSRATVRSGLTAGSNTFTAKYRAQANTAFFLNRSITVIPLP